MLMQTSEGIGALEGTPTLQTALLVLRSSWPGALLHLFRQFPHAVTMEFIETVKWNFMDTFVRLVNLPPLTGPRMWTISLPIAHGGFALPRIPTLALAARTALLAKFSPTDLNQPYFQRHLQARARIC